MTVIEFYDLLKDKQETLRTEADLWKHASHEDEAKSTIARIVLMTFRTPLPPYPMLSRAVAKESHSMDGTFLRSGCSTLFSDDSTLDRGEGGCDWS